MGVESYLPSRSSLKLRQWLGYAHCSVTDNPTLELYRLMVRPIKKVWLIQLEKTIQFPQVGPRR